MECRSMRSMKFTALALFAAVAFAPGCSNQHRQTQHEQATKQWSNARATVLCGLARDQYQTGNLDKSRQTCDEALNIDPTYAPLHLLSARLAIEQGQLERAEHELKEATKIDPKVAEADYLLGVVYQRWQKPEAALDAYARASSKQPAELAYVMAESEMLVALDRESEALS